MFLQMGPAFSFARWKAVEQAYGVFRFREAHCAAYWMMFGSAAMRGHPQRGHPTESFWLTTPQTGISMPCGAMAPSLTNWSPLLIVSQLSWTETDRKRAKRRR